MFRVCPFIKPVGKNCVVEKAEDQCCPTISCPPGECYMSNTYLGEAVKVEKKKYDIFHTLGFDPHQPQTPKNVIIHTVIKIFLCILISPF